MKSEIITLSSAIIAAFLLTTTTVYAQLQQPLIQLPQVQTPQQQPQPQQPILPTGTFNPNPRAQEPNEKPLGTPPPAFTPKITQDLQQSSARLHSIISSFIIPRLGSDTSSTHLLQVFKLLAQQGLINCPPNFTQVSQCSI